MTSSGSPTRYDWVDARLQAAIATGHVGPGERVKVADLAAEWTVSPTPLREAVQRLAARGVLDLSPQRGARVASVSLAEADELYDLRVQLEPQALRSSMAAADEDYRIEVRDAHKALVALAKPQRGPASAADVYLAHRAFHDATLSRCTSRWLLRLVAALMDQSMRYIRFSHSADAPRSAEHDGLLSLIVAGNVEQAALALHDHLEISRRHLRKALASAGHE